MLPERRPTRLSGVIVLSSSENKRDRGKRKRKRRNRRNRRVRANRSRTNTETERDVYPLPQLSPLIQLLQTFSEPVHS
jgi:hypothetical protein